MKNLPIAYDDHGDIPFDVPFREIAPSAISIYLQLNTQVGKPTCRQACAHCFFINQPLVRGRSMDLAEGRRVMEDLERVGYKVFPMISDSFANGGEFLRLFGRSHNRDLHQGASRAPTTTMERGHLWTSGAPLRDENWKDLLLLGLEQGFGSVAISFHGLLDTHLRLRPMSEYPIRGVFPGGECEKVLRRLRLFNEDVRDGRPPPHVPASSWKPLEVGINVTIGSHNHSRRDLLRYVEYFRDKGIALLRFNCFHDHGRLHPQLMLSRSEIAQVYADLKWIHTNIAFEFQLGVDEDFGTSGIEVMGFPPHTGWCRAGRQLFAVVPDAPVPLRREGPRRFERVGNVAACVDAFKPIVGELVRILDESSGSCSYRLDFFEGVIEELNEKRRTGVYSDGCFATEMLQEGAGAGIAE